MIKVGDKIPAGRVQKISSQGAGVITSDELFNGKKVVVFGVPGAFTPVCSEKHVPGFLVMSDKFKAKGVDTIACLSVNDIHVMNAWAKEQHVGDVILMLADGTGKFTKSIGMDIDHEALGLRSKRFAMVVDNGVVQSVAVEPNTSAHSVSSAEEMLKQV